MNCIASTANITPITLIGPQFKILGHCLDRTRTYQHSSNTTAYASITSNDDSISTFNTDDAHLSAQSAKDNNTMNQLSKTNQTLQSNLNIIMQELQQSTMPNEIQ